MGVKDNETLRQRLPGYFRKEIPRGELYFKVKEILSRYGLNTVCESARCPNRGECFSRGRVTFMILGDICTRHCGFCEVKKVNGVRKLRAPDSQEPGKIAEAANELGLKHIVITSVTRDDLPDGGAKQFAACINAIHSRLPGASIEVLTMDFGGDIDAWNKVISARPTVFNHNLETVRRLSKKMRPEADYSLSLKMLEYVKRREPEIITKSGLILGLGEKIDEIVQSLRDLRSVGCDFVTLGQYLSPGPKNVRVERFVTPDEFEFLRWEAKKMGFRKVFSGPLVRSSYDAEEMMARVEAMAGD